MVVFFWEHSLLRTNPPFCLDSDPEGPHFRSWFMITPGHRLGSGKSASHFQAPFSGDQTRAARMYCARVRRQGASAFNSERSVLDIRSPRLEVARRREGVDQRVECLNGDIRAPHLQGIQAVIEAAREVLQRLAVSVDDLPGRMGLLLDQIRKGVGRGWAHRPLLHGLRVHPLGCGSLCSVTIPALRCAGRRRRLALHPAGEPASNLGPERLKPGKRREGLPGPRADLRFFSDDAPTQREGLAPKVQVHVFQVML